MEKSELAIDKEPIQQSYLNSHTASSVIDIFNTKYLTGDNELEMKYQQPFLSLKTALETVSKLVLTDKQGRIVYVSKSFCEALQYDEKELIGTLYLSLYHHLFHGEEREYLKNVFLNASESTTVETVPHTKEGNPLIMKTTVMPINTNESGEALSLIIHQDVTTLKQAEKTIKQLVTVDNLTGLPNRDKFEQDILGLINEEKETEKSFAVFFIDLDRFKYYNDTLGHFTGDKLIQVIAYSLTGLNIKHLHIYRYGGDEFSFIFKSPESRKAVQHLAEKVLELFHTPFIVNGNELIITASIGITLCPVNGKNLEDIVLQAETAMHHAKERGKDNFQWFQTNIRTKYNEKLFMEKRLRLAAEQKNFKLHYQPQIDLRTNKVIGVEALIRWEDSKLGTVSPDKFIPLAEETGLINPIGDWVLEEASRQAKEWNDQGYCIRMGINISPLQFQRSDFVSKVKDILKTTGINPELLDLEITENDLLYNRTESFRTLERLKETGIRISIDDFGTGYSSLSYLRRFPIDTLKIDQTFIKDVLENSNDQAIVTSIIQLAHNLNLRVIAEGVETKEMVLYLNKKKCDEMQGFLYSKPLPPSTMLDFINNNSPEEIIKG